MHLPYKFGKYVLVQKIASGGMAEIYRAKYHGEGGFVKEVAVKRILPAWSGSGDFVTMLCDEAKALVHLQHQNIVQVYELGKDGNAFYISMEYVEGVDLRRFIRRLADARQSSSNYGDPPLKYVCFIVAEILKAIDFAHNRKDKQGNCLGIIHRDISPQNILVSYNGEVKVADFGIAKGKHRSFETAVVQVKGKYAYMSPEQAEGRPLDLRSDLYSIGVVLYELLTRKRLYDAPNDLLTIEEVKKSVLPEGWEADVPIGIRPIVRRALQRDPSDRYQTANDFLNDLNKFATANKCLTHGIELSIFIKELFKDEHERSLKEDAADVEIDEGELKHETRVLSVIAKTEPEVRKRPLYRKKWLALAASFIIVVMATVAFSIINSVKMRSSAEEIKVPPVQEAVLPLPPPPIPVPQAIQKVVQEQVQEPPKLVAGGLLNVQARPWGYVFLPGYVSKKETPVKGVKIKPGDYTLKVYYEPEDKWVQQKLTVAENSKITCVANFEKSSKLTCLNNK